MVGATSWAPPQWVYRSVKGVIELPVTWRCCYRQVVLSSLRADILTPRTSEQDCLEVGLGQNELFGGLLPY